MIAKWITIAALTIPMAAHAADARPLTLQETIDIALNQAPEVLASQASLDAADARAPSGGRLPDPELIAAVDNLPIEGEDKFSLTSDFMTMRRIGVGAQVTLVDREAHRALDDGEAAALTGGYRIPDRPGAVVVLVRRREQNAAAGQA